MSPLKCCLALLLPLSAPDTEAFAQTAPPLPAGMQVFFSPKGGCGRAVVRAVDGARKSVLIQAYGFTNKAIAEAAVRASRRGVEVRAILDKSNETSKYSAAEFLVRMKIPVWIDGSHPIAHDKVMIIDAETVITGSFNFTKKAEEENAENLLLISNGSLAALYEKNWLKHLSHSDSHAGRPGADGKPIKSTKIMAVSFIPGKWHIRVRWGPEAEVLMEQLVVLGERAVWVGNPWTEAINKPEDVFPKAAGRGRRQERRMMVILEKDQSQPFAQWVRFGDFGRIIHGQGVGHLWYGYPDDLHRQFVSHEEAELATVKPESEQE